MFSFNEKAVSGMGPGVVRETDYGLSESLAVTIYTDYTNVAVRYSCIMLGTKKQEYFYVLSRNRSPNSLDQLKLFRAFEELQKVPVNLSNLQFNVLFNDDSCTN